MTKHPRHVEGYSGSLDELAQAVGNLQYDKASNFIEALAQDLQSQAAADAQRGREQLSSALYQAAQELYEAKTSMDQAWNICKQYMKYDKNPMQEEDTRSEQ